MDYSFYTLSVAASTQSLMDKLIQYSEESVNDPRAKEYFGQGVNRGFGSHSIPSSIKDAHPTIAEAVDCVSNLFSPSQFTSVEMNWLESNAQIKMHTDQSSATSTTSINEKYGTRVSSYHSLHIPLTGEGTYLFRRSMRESEIQEEMRVGWMYLFNNYAMHRVENNRQELRRNMILHFYDPTWASKQKIYRQHNIRGVY